MLRLFRNKGSKIKYVIMGCKKCGTSTNSNKANRGRIIKTASTSTKSTPKSKVPFTIGGIKFNPS